MTSSRSRVHLGGSVNHTKDISILTLLLSPRRMISGSFKVIKDSAVPGSKSLPPQYVFLATCLEEVK